MKQRRLIVNADDFGLSPGVNQGIIETHVRGIVTSASLMTRFAAAKEAALLAHQHPGLSVGLHLDLGEWIWDDCEWKALYLVVDLADPGQVRAELARQLARFRKLMEREPTHLDSHQHTHLEEPALSVTLEVADLLGIPLRGRSRINYCGGLYGQTDEGLPNHDAISMAGFREILAELGPGDHELSCHPGYPDGLRTMYRNERVMEIDLLCSPEARAAVSEAGYGLCSFGDVTSRN